MFVSQFLPNSLDPPPLMTWVKIVEQAGISLKRLRQRSDPLRQSLCSRDDCFICKEGEGRKGLCALKCVTYEIKCKECGDVYVGETSRNTYTQGKEHLRLLAGKQEESALWRHCEEKHGGIEQDFSMNVTSSCRSDPMARQIAEAVRVRKIPAAQLMNTRTEWNYVRIPRATLVE